MKEFDEALNKQRSSIKECEYYFQKNDYKSIIRSSGTNSCNVSLYSTNTREIFSFEKLFDNLKSDLLQPNSYGFFEFDSRLVATEDLSYPTKRLLECDNPLLIPMGIPIRFLTTSLDVLHS
jgi:heme/copper-type cytochrome/quinol oxidase subunit 2